MKSQASGSQDRQPIYYTIGRLVVWYVPFQESLVPADSDAFLSNCLPGGSATTGVDGDF